MEMPESQLKDSQLMRMLEQPLSSSRAEKAFAESDMEEKEEDIFLLTRSTLNLLSELWNSNKSMLHNLKVTIGFLQSYTIRGRSIRRPYVCVRLEL